VLTKTLTKETRRELRQFGVHVTRCNLVDFVDCKVFKLLTSQADRQGMSSHQFYSPGVFDRDLTSEISFEPPAS
jgi:hypothetical protein